MWAVVEYIQNIWHSSTFIVYKNNNSNELRASDGIVKNLNIPESTKPFVYAFREPESQAVIYVLAVQNLSERSAVDAECLIREIKPDAVVVQVGKLSDSEMAGLRDGRGGLVRGGNGGCDDTVPTSVFDVLINCFMHKINKEKYEDVAGSLALREIFGVSFNGHLISAKKTAEEVGSSFLMLDSPFVNCNVSDDVESSSEGADSGINLQRVLSLQPHNMVTKTVGSSIMSMTPRAFRVVDEIQAQMVKSLSAHLVSANPSLKLVSEGVLQPLADYEVPQFAKCVYPLLVDLHDIFADIPSIGTALACAQKLLSDVNKGEVVDNRLLSEVYAFQIAVEGLRIALNNAGRVIRNPVRAHSEFSDLSMDDQTHAILAQALRSQTKKFKSIVAVVDASGLAGLRKNWNTAVPAEVKDMVDDLVIDSEGDNNDDDENPMQSNRKWKLTNKPVVAVGAGATAVIGVSSFSKAIPASSLVKVATLKVPVSLKLVLTQTQKAFFMVFGKGLGTTKIVAGSSLKGSTVKAVASAEKIRAVTHSVIASVEKTSLSAMRSAFYEIMRKRQVRRVGVLPWATFGCSIATCAGLLAYGDGIECVTESIPAAPSIASLGRGIESLHVASQAVRASESSRIQRSIESLIYQFKKLKIKIQ